MVLMMLLGSRRTFQQALHCLIMGYALSGFYLTIEKRKVPLYSLTTPMVVIDLWLTASMHFFSNYEMKMKWNKGNHMNKGKGSKMKILVEINSSKARISTQPNNLGPRLRWRKRVFTYTEEKSRFADHVINEGHEINNDHNTYGT